MKYVDIAIRKVSKKDLGGFKVFIKTCSAQYSIPCLNKKRN